MNSDVECKIIEAAGPIVLVVVPNWEYARILADNLRAQYKDLVTGSMARLRIEGGKEIRIISAYSPLAMRGQRGDDLIIHPHIYAPADIRDINELLSVYSVKLSLQVDIYDIPTTGDI